MPAKRLSMRNTREILRLRWSLGRSLRETGRSCGVGPSTVHDVVARATAAGLSWPLPEELDDAALEGRLYQPPVGRRDRAVPNFGHIYRELKRRGRSWICGHFLLSHLTCWVECRFRRKPNRHSD